MTTLIHHATQHFGSENTDL